MIKLDFEYIDSEKQFKEYYEKLKEEKCKLIAVDFEYESNLHEYGEKLCLIQLFDGKDKIIIDPFKISLTYIKKILEKRKILKIMFSAAGDRAFMYKNYQIDIRSILDLQAAAKVLQLPKHDLLSVLKHCLNLKADFSKKKFQKYNWNRRPIKQEALDYALLDVIYLFNLKDYFYQELANHNLWDSFNLENIQSQNKPHKYDDTPRVFKSQEFMQLPNFLQEKYIALYELRDRYARKLNLPPNSVLVNDLLFMLVKAKKNLDEIKLGKRVPECIQETALKEIEIILKNSHE